MTGRARMGVAVALLVAGLGLITVAELALRAPRSAAPIGPGGQVHGDAAGHTAREILVSGLGMAIALAGAILLVSGRDPDRPG